MRVSASGWLALTLGGAALLLGGAGLFGPGAQAVAPAAPKPTTTTGTAQPLTPPPGQEATYRDTDRDGYPDVAELTGDDRARFADWFAAIAESQYYGMNRDWAAADRDCAGLLRYAFINALMPHDAAWRAKFKFLPPVSSRPVQNLSYPLPVISRSVFRVAGGAYQYGDINAGKLVGRTGAQYLANYSAVKVGGDIRQAQRGDLLFFLRPRLASYHSMVYLGGGMVVYHTGGTAAEGGEVRLLSVQTLMKYADPAFHPDSRNPNFLGVYRWKIQMGH